MKPSELQTLCVSQIAAAIIVKNIGNASVFEYIMQAEAVYNLIHERAKARHLKENSDDRNL